MSVREHLAVTFAGQMHSNAQFARAGRASHNNLDGFDFEIHDPLAVETLIHPGTKDWQLIKCGDLVQMKVAYHHAFERESIDIRQQYESALLYDQVTPPDFITK